MSGGRNQAGFLPEAFVAFAEPQGHRIVLPIGEPPGRLQGRITHELARVFDLFGYPRHLDWTLRTLFDDARSDQLFGRDWRRPRFNVWVGFDFQATSLRD
ncbi:MAG: hypothetical protein HYX76_01070 [Acidobacteria bacterium]|nr:hypothetical protein [Acidobacteriota bacterium]